MSLGSVWVRCEDGANYEEPHWLQESFEGDWLWRIGVDERDGFYINLRKGIDPPTLPWIKFKRPKKDTIYWRGSDGYMCCSISGKRRTAEGIPVSIPIPDQYDSVSR